MKKLFVMVLAGVFSGAAMASDNENCLAFYNGVGPEEIAGIELEAIPDSICGGGIVSPSGLNTRHDPIEFVVSGPKRRVVASFVVKEIINERNLCGNAYYKLGVGFIGDKLVDLSGTEIILSRQPNTSAPVGVAYPIYIPSYDGQLLEHTVAAPVSRKNR